MSAMRINLEKVHEFERANHCLAYQLLWQISDGDILIKFVAKCPATGVVDSSTIIAVRYAAEFADAN